MFGRLTVLIVAAAACVALLGSADQAQAACVPYLNPHPQTGTCPVSGNWGSLANNQAQVLNLCDPVPLALNHKMQNINGQPGYSKQVTNFFCSSGNPQNSTTSSSALVTLSVPVAPPTIYYRCRNVSGGSMGAQCWRSV